MEEKRSRKPLLIVLLVVIAAVLAAMFITPTVAPVKVEEPLDSSGFAG